MNPAETAAIEALQARGRFGIRLGLGRTRALLRGARAPRSAGCAARSSAAPTARAAPRRWSPRCWRPRVSGSGRPPSRTWSAIGSGSWSMGRPSRRPTFAVAGGRGPRGRRPGRAPPRAAHRVRGAHRARRCCGSRGRVSTSAWWRWVSGGRLDATNAWDGGVAAITNVALDHMEYLGDVDRGHRAREGGHHQARRPGSHGRGRRRAGGRPSPRPAHGRAAPR